MLADKQWYAIYTRPRWEKKVAGLLESKNIITYCPLNRVLRQWSDRKKVVSEPLFRSYVFVRVNKDEMLIVSQTVGVIKFVYWLNKPAVIRDEEIAIIKEFLNEYMNVTLEKVDIDVNDKVRIVNGPFTEYEGNILEINKHKVKVYLQSLRYLMIVEVPKNSIELLKKTDPVKLAGSGSSNLASAANNQRGV